MQQDDNTFDIRQYKYNPTTQIKLGKAEIFIEEFKNIVVQNNLQTLWNVLNTV